MNIASILTRRVATVEMDDTLQTIRDIFENVKFHHILVVKNRKLVGLISDRDLLKSLSPFLGTLSERTLDMATLNRKAHQIMSRKLITLKKETSIEAAANLMLENNVSCLPVTSRQGDVEGIVTWKDIFRCYFEHSSVDSLNKDQ